VTPFYYAALNALDFSLAAERIGDRGKALKPRTMERIRFGLEKYGKRVARREREAGRARLVARPGDAGRRDSDAGMTTSIGTRRHAGRSCRVEDCYFRMLQPHEIGAAMAFPAVTWSAATSAIA
jgi:hypothetical protein